MQHKEKLLKDVSLLIKHHNIEFGVLLLDNVRCFLSQCPDDDVLDGVTVYYDEEEEVSIGFNWNLPPLLSNISFEEYGFQWLIELGGRYSFQDEGFEELDLETGIMDATKYNSKYAYFFVTLQKYLEQYQSAYNKDCNNT